MGKKIIGGALVAGAFAACMASGAQAASFPVTTPNAVAAAPAVDHVRWGGGGWGGGFRGGWGGYRGGWGGYRGWGYGGWGYRRGWGAGPFVAGAALGLVGAAALSGGYYGYPGYGYGYGYPVGYYGGYGYGYGYPVGYGYGYGWGGPYYGYYGRPIYRARYGYGRRFYGPRYGYGRPGFYRAGYWGRGYGFHHGRGHFRHF